MKSGFCVTTNLCILSTVVSRPPLVMLPGSACATLRFTAFKEFQCALEHNHVTDGRTGFACNQTRFHCIVKDHFLCSLLQQLPDTFSEVKKKIINCVYLANLCSMH